MVFRTFLSINKHVTSNNGRLFVATQYGTLYYYEVLNVPTKSKNNYTIRYKLMNEDLILFIKQVSRLRDYSLQ